MPQRQEYVYLHALLSFATITTPLMKQFISFERSYIMSVGIVLILVGLIILIMEDKKD